MKKYNIEGLKKRFERELHALIIKGGCPAEIENLKNRYHVLYVLAEVENMQTSPSRYWMVPCSLVPFINPQKEHMGQMIDLLCHTKHQAIEKAQAIAEYTKTSWRLYEGENHIVTVLVKDGKSISVDADKQNDVMMTQNFLFN